MKEMLIPLNLEVESNYEVDQSKIDLSHTIFVLRKVSGSLRTRQKKLSHQSLFW